MVNSMVPGDKICPQHQLLGPMSFLLMKLSITRDEFLCSFFLFLSFFPSPPLSFILPFRLDLPFFFPSLSHYFFFFHSVSFSRLVPEGARPAGSTGQLRETLLRVITSNLERSVFSFDTCTDMLQIFSDYFTTLRNLILRILTRNLPLYFSFTHSCSTVAPFFLKERIVDVSHTHMILAM